MFFIFYFYLYFFALCFLYLNSVVEQLLSDFSACVQQGPSYLPSVMAGIQVWMLLLNPAWLILYSDFSDSAWMVV